MTDLIIREVSRSFNGKKVLDRFSAELRQGKRYCLMAPSGAGKTTLLRILAGLDTGYTGSIEGLSGCRITMQFQEDRLLEHLDAADNIRFVSPGIPLTEIETALSVVGLSAENRQPVGEYSGGMQRRVSLVRALLYPADLLLLDEPFTGLDKASLEKAVRFLLERSSGKTLLFTTHLEEEARRCGAKILHLWNGV